MLKHTHQTRGINSKITICDTARTPIQHPIQIHVVTIFSRFPFVPAGLKIFDKANSNKKKCILKHFKLIWVPPDTFPTFCSFQKLKFGTYFGSSSI